MTRTEPRTEPSDEVHESRQSLWRLVAAPSIWLAYFVLSYASAATWCARLADRGGGFSTIRVAIAVYTAVALAGIGLIGRDGYRRHRHGTETGRHDFDSPAGRHKFLGFATLLLAALSAIATLYVALAVTFIGRCW